MIPYGLYIILAAALPCVFFIWLLDRFDRFKKEPRLLLFGLFAAGMVTPLAASLLEGVLIPLLGVVPGGSSHIINAFIGIAVPEEAVKLAALLLIVRRRRQFDEVLDGAVYGVTVGMGFALVENLMYVFESDTPMSVALVRGVTAVPLHALAGGLIGLIYGRYRIESSGSIMAAYLAAVGIHGLYDMILFNPNIADFVIVPLLIAGWWLLVKMLKRARKDDILAGRHFPPAPG
jgi:RsiW-degrading membrane proteinase PrsW (M82 family)